MTDSWRVEHGGFLEDNGNEYIENLLVIKHRTCCVLQSLWVVLHLSLLQLQEHRLQDGLVPGDIHPGHVVAHERILHVDHPLLDDEEEGDSALLDPELPLVRGERPLQDLHALLLHALGDLRVAEARPVEHTHNSWRCEAIQLLVVVVVGV